MPITGPAAAPSPAGVQCRRWWPLVVVLPTLLAGSGAISTLAQPAQPPATVSGTVVDQMGGFLPKVALVLTDAKKKTRKSRTDKSGYYEFVRLPPGEYLLDVLAVGFMNPRETLILTGQNLQRDITLQLGGLTETVIVTEPVSYDSGPERRPPAPVCDEPTVPGRRGGRIVPPIKFRHVTPPYPGRLKTAGIVGNVVVAGVLGTDGLMTQLEVVHSAHPDLARVAVEAMSQWQFSPLYLNCVPFALRAEVTFELQMVR